MSIRSGSTIRPSPFGAPMRPATNLEKYGFAAPPQSCGDRPLLRCGAAMRKAASVGDYRALAKARLPHFLFEYLDGGSYDEVTLGRNVADLQAVALRQRVLRDVSDIVLSTELFGQRWDMPVGLGPVGLSGLYAR